MNKLTSYTIFYYTMFDGEVHSYGDLNDSLYGLDPANRIANMLCVNEDNIFVYAIVEEAFCTSELKTLIIKLMAESIVKKHNTEWVKENLDDSIEAKIRRIRERKK